MATSQSADLDPRRSLLLRGVLDMCVLATVRRQPDHVYGLVRRLADRGLDKVSFGSLYPLVTRLRQQGLLDDRTVPGQLGPPRSVLSLTEAGQAALERWTKQWQTVNLAVGQILDDEFARPISGQPEEAQ